MTIPVPPELYAETVARGVEMCLHRYRESVELPPLQREEPHETGRLIFPTDGRHIGERAFYSLVEEVSDTTREVGTLQSPVEPTKPKLLAFGVRLTITHLQRMWPDDDPPSIFPPTWLDTWKAHLFAMLHALVDELDPRSDPA